MKLNLPGRILPLVLLVALSRGAGAENRPATQPASVPAYPWQQIELTVQAAPLPKPSLTEELLPPAAQMTAGNSAPLYYIAAVLASSAMTPWPGRPTYDEINDWLTLPPDQFPREAARGFVNSNSAMLHLLELAGRREQCDWGLPWREDGFNTLLPQLNGLRMASWILATQARLQIIDGEFELALRTLQTGNALARNLNQQAAIVQALAAAAIEATVIQQIDAWVSYRQSPNLYWALTELPHPFIDGQAAMRLEHGMVYTLPYFEAARDGRIAAEQWQETLGILQEITRPNERPVGQFQQDAITADCFPKATRFLVGEGVSSSRLKAMQPFQVVAMFAVHDYEQWAQESSKWFALPYAIGHEKMLAAQQEFARAKIAGDVGPVAAVVFPATSKAYTVFSRLDRKIAILRLVEALRAYAATHGNTWPQSLEAVTEVPVPQDPMTDRPFGYETRGNACTIKAPAPKGENSREEIRYLLSMTP
jgi:hypothetical protein